MNKKDFIEWRDKRLSKTIDKLVTKGMGDGGPYAVAKLAADEISEATYELLAMENKMYINFAAEMAMLSYEKALKQKGLETLEVTNREFVGHLNK